MIVAGYALDLYCANHACQTQPLYPGAGPGLVEAARAQYAGANERECRAAARRHGWTFFRLPGGAEDVACSPACKAAALAPTPSPAAIAADLAAFGAAWPEGGVPVDIAGTETLADPNPTE